MTQGQHQHNIRPVASSVADYTDASTGTSTTIKSLIIPLNNHLNMTNAMVSLMMPSASCYREHGIAMDVAKMNMPLKCHIFHICQILHRQIQDNVRYLPQMSSMQLTM